MILESITNKVRSTIAGRLNSAISGAVKSSVSSLTGAAKEGATSALGSIAKGGKYGTTILTYPTNVDSDSQQGHYIVFDVREFTAGKIEHVNSKKDFSKLESQVEDFEFVIPKDVLSGGTKGRKSILAEKPTVRTGTVISLYMPPSLSVSYNVTYADQEIGTLAGMGQAAIAAFQKNDGDLTSNLTAAASAIKPGAKEGLTNFINTTLDTLAPGARALQQINSGKVITPRMEMMFEGVGRRSFSYKFDFIPKSAQEAKSIERIIYAFKENMMPEYTGESRREMKIPNTFDIRYMYQGKDNKFINKISSCFLKDMEVTYGGDRFTAYDPIDGSPPPQRSSISLSFTEIETLSKDLIKEGY